MWTDALAAFREHFPSFEERPQQTRLAEAIERNLAVPGSQLCAQAGTGTGKSYAAMISAIDKALDSGDPAIMSTGTKVLMQQYIADLDTLQRIYPRPFTYTLLKGRGNYVCMAKLNDPKTELRFSDFDSVAAELAEHPTGDFADLTKLDSKDEGALSTSSEECTGSDCPFYEQCFANKARQRAQESDVVVVNHMILCLDAAIRGPKAAPGTMKMLADGTMKEIGWSGPMLPHHSCVVADEAHELAEWATKALGNELKEKQLHRLAEDTLDYLGREAFDRFQAVRTEITVLYSKLADLVPGRETSRGLNGDLVAELADTIVVVAQGFQGLANEVTAITVYGDDQRQQAKKRLVKRLDNMINKLQAIVLGEFDEVVRSVEKSTWTDRKGEVHTDIVLKTQPISVADFLARCVWAYTPSVLLSATLAVGGDFSLIQREVGFDHAETFDAGTPFDYTTQAITYCPKITSPKVSRERWMADVADHAQALIEASDGRALVLFTSRSALNEAHRALAPKIEALGHKVLKQGDLPNNQLAAIFKADEHSVLFATRSFFTGVDIQGDSLRLVIVDRLPFANPSDVLIKAKCDLIDAKASNKWKDGAFPKFTIPSMALTLIQAQGRLIRTKNDKGVFALLDPRAVTEGYGKKILAALPPSPVVGDLAVATEFLRDLDTDTEAVDW